MEDENFDLKIELKKLGLSQTDFANLTKQHTNTISQWIRGVRKMPEWVPEFLTHYKKSKALDNIISQIDELKKQ